MRFEPYQAGFTNNRKHKSNVTGKTAHRAGTAVLAALLSGVLATVAGPSSLAQTDDGKPDTTIEEIIVTGSRIKRRDYSSPSPIMTLETSDIAFSGQSTIEELLNKMPQVLPGFGRTANNPGNGTAQIDLRGMGEQRTLVLLNGRRVAASGAGSAVDLNNLPQALIERIEIITGGASAVYGSDAVSGVVNFITRDDFDGFSIETHFDVTEKGDAQSYDLNVVYGHDFESGGNVTVFLNYHERKSLMASEREFTRVTWIDNPFDGSLTIGGSPSIPGTLTVYPDVDFGAGPQQATFDPDGTPRPYIPAEDFYNYAPHNYLQIPLTRYSGGLMANVPVSDNFEAYTEVFFNRNESAQELAPVPAWFWPAEVNIDNPILTPETRQLLEDNFLISPGLASFYAQRRMTEVGNRKIEHQRDYWRVVAGVRGDVWADWDLDAWAIWSGSDEKQVFLNDVSFARLMQGLLVDPLTGACFDPSNGCVAINIYGAGNVSAEAAEFIRIDNMLNSTEREQFMVSLVLTGSPFELWARPVDVAFGVDWRSDDSHFEADPALFTDDSLGFGGEPSINGSESVTEFYSEAIIPLAEGLPWADYMALEAGARYSIYENAGEVWTYKLGGEWTMFQGLGVRVMQQRSVRAPNIQEQFTEQMTVVRSFVENTTSRDPCSASADPVGNNNVGRCVLQGLDVAQVGLFEATPFYPAYFTFGGNPDLEPEEANTRTYGAIFRPDEIPGLTVSADYYEIEISGSIGTIDASAICFDALNTEDVFCTNILRDATGNVVEVTQLNSNRGMLRTRGVDTQVRYSFDLPKPLKLFEDSAGLAVNLVWTHLMSVESQQNPATTILNCLGRFGGDCNLWEKGKTQPVDKVMLAADYTSGPMFVHLNWRWIGGSENAAQLGFDILGLGQANPAIPHIGTKNYIDLGFGWRVNDDISVRFGINNLTDNQPPFMANNVYGNNTDTQLYDIFGRSYFLSVSASF